MEIGQVRALVIVVAYSAMRMYATRVQSARKERGQGLKEL